MARSYVMMDYDIPSRAVADAVALTPGHREPDGRPAASRGLGGGPGDGPARRRPAADGRALRPRRPRHPAHRHPCLPALSAGPAGLPHTWRPLGVRASPGWSSAARCWPSASFAVVRLRRGDPREVHAVPARHPDLRRAARLLAPGTPWSARAWSPTADRLVVVNGYRRRESSGPRSSPCTCRRARPGPPSTSPTAPPSPRWASRAPTATGPAAPSASSARSRPPPLRTR